MADIFDYELYEKHYSFRLVAPQTWQISTKSEETPWGCDCYLLEGDTHAVMIDSGMSRLNMKTYIEQLGLTERPILGVINTHSHFDHTGGNSYFGYAYMHPLALAGARKTPFRNQSVEEYDLNYEVTCITEGYRMELGNRELEILEIGAHDPSSIAILDHDRRILFSGDEIETGWINVGSMNPEYHPAETIESHYENMLKLDARRNEYDMICTGHHGSPIAADSLEHFLTCDRRILDGFPGSKQNPACNGPGGPCPPTLRVMRYKSAHICYREDRRFIRKEV